MKETSRINKPTKRYTEATLVFSLAVTVALLIKILALFGFDLDQNEGFTSETTAFLYFQPLSFTLAGNDRWNSDLSSDLLLDLLLQFYLPISTPFEAVKDTETLTALHLPIALWLIVGIAYTGGRWNEVNARMNFIRFTGEMFVYYVLIALGGGVLMGFMSSIFQTIAIDIEPFLNHGFYSAVQLEPY